MTKDETRCPARLPLMTALMSPRKGMTMGFGFEEVIMARVAGAVLTCEDCGDELTDGICYVCG